MSDLNIGDKVFVDEDFLGYTAFGEIVGAGPHDQAMMVAVAGEGTQNIGTYYLSKPHT